MSGNQITFVMRIWLEPRLIFYHNCPQNKMTFEVSGNLEGLLATQNAFNQFVPVRIEHAARMKMIKKMIPQPQPLQLHPRPNPNWRSSQLNSESNRKSSSKPWKQP